MTRIALRAVLAASLVAIAFSFPPPAQAESPNDILVVVNNASPISSTSLDELRNVFLKKKSAWRSGSPVTPINAAAGSALRKQFQRAVLGMTETEEREYWKVTKIQGGSTEPSTINDTMKAVFKLRNGVSYIYRSQFKEGLVKIVHVIPAR